MAKLDKNTRKGKLGEFIYYNWKGKQCIRSKPRQFERTEASVKSGLNFGKASRIGSELRDLIKSINPGKNDNQVTYRLTGALNKFISWKEKQIAVPVEMFNDLPYLKDFQFNDQADMSNMTFLKVSAKITKPGNIEISLPSFKTKKSAPYRIYSNQIKCKLILVGIDLDKDETEEYGNAVIETPYKEEIFDLPVVTMRTAAEPGKLMILVMALQYFRSVNDESDMLTDRKQLPCGIALAYLS
ncbi:MAG TPA: hypothetical protein VK711_10740 [Puia sp.]|nr:hypothetical protein [Puia sp.]